MILKRILKRRSRADLRRGSGKGAAPAADPVAELDGLLAEAGEQQGPRLRELLAAGADGLPLQRRLEALERCADPVLLAYVARNAREVEVRLAAVDRVSGERLLEEVALHDRASRVRQRAVARLQTRAALERVYRAAKGQDARVAREARQRLDAIESAEARASAAREAHEQLCAEAQRLLETVPLEAVEAAVQRLQNRWSAQPAAATNEQAQRFQEALERALGALRADQERRRPVQARIRALQELAAEITAADAQTLASVQSALESLDRDPLPDPLPEDLRDALSEARCRLDQWVEDMRAWFAHQGSIEAMLDALDDPEQATNPAHRENLQRQLQTLPWRTDLPEPELLRGARQRLAQSALRAAPPRPKSPPDQRDPRLQARRQGLQAMLPEAQQALDGGDLRRARRLLNRALHRAEGLPRGERQHWDEALRPLLARVQELQDWRRFAVLPKQEALCERMEALAAQPLPPPEQVEAIRGLRAEWKALGGSDSRESRRLWERFQAAAAQAFEPCRSWYQEQQALRRRNLAERERIVRQLQEFLDSEAWAQTPLADLERIHATAKAEWRQASPVEAQAARTIKRQFRKAMDRLGEALGRHRQALREEKKRLLEEARALAQETNLAAAAARARELQAAWRALAPLPAGEERRRHRELRAACDAVFQRLREQHAQTDQRRHQERLECERICQRLEETERQRFDPSALQQRLEDAQRDWSAIPGSVRKGFQARFRAAESMVLARLEQARRQAWLDGLAPLQQAAALVRGLEGAVQSGASDARLQSLRDAWARLPLQEIDGAECLAERWEQAEALLRGATGYPAQTLEQGRDTRRQLCVELEIVAGVDSPDPDRALRMRLQVERLSASLGHPQSERGHGGDLQRLVREWYLLGPWPLDVEDAWEARFCRALHALRG